MSEVQTAELGYPFDGSRTAAEAEEENKGKEGPEMSQDQESETGCLVALGISTVLWTGAHLFLIYLLVRFIKWAWAN
jgi:hypothetical protein